jgi:hypothetical protein
LFFSPTIIEKTSADVPEKRETAKSIRRCHQFPIFHWLFDWVFIDFKQTQILQKYPMK